MGCHKLSCHVLSKIGKWFGQNVLLRFKKNKLSEVGLSHIEKYKNEWINHRLLKGLSHVGAVNKASSRQLEALKMELGCGDQNSLTEQVI